MHKNKLKKWALKFVCLLIMFLGISISVPTRIAAEDFLDRLMERCSKGDTKACSEIDKLREKYTSQIDRLNAQADAFQAEVHSLNIENNNKPDIRKAYPLILYSYMSSNAVEPIHRARGLNPDQINLCARHLHDLYFKHGKEIPSLESGKPDWGIIYLVVIDHYFRYCSRQNRDK